VSEAINLEEHVVRWRDIAKRKSPFRPRDMALPQFERERYVVLGRPHEAPTGGPRTIENDHFTMVCITAEPGKGFASHAHATVSLSSFWQERFAAPRGTRA